MPRVKIDYVVSFSSEDPEHPASNLLNREVSKKKWLCKKGEASCSVVLQLAKAVKISAVHIGAYHAALVEVLVARSETCSEQFQVLVPSSVFLSREESRRDAGLERVRSFSAEQLSQPARDQRWDRLRIVAQQPYNKHCKYGVSFVHIDEAESAGAGAGAAGAGAVVAVPRRLLTLDTFSSDEDEFKPGELFAKHQQKTNTSDTSTPNTHTNTGAQIRQATSQALKNIPESSTKLMKTPISKPSVARSTADTERAGDRSTDRSRDTLLYTRDDEQPHDKIDRVLHKHNEEKRRHDTNKHDKLDTKQNDKTNVSSNKTRDSTAKLKDDKNITKINKSVSPPRNQTSESRPNKNNDRLSDQKDKELRKRKRSDSQEKPGPVSEEPHTLLSGAVLVLSGYENPLRAQVRATALALGARVERDWAPHCTHLICAFPNTPKLRAVRAGGGGGGGGGAGAGGGAPVPAPRAEWVQQCAARRRLLPWRWFAAEPHLRTSPTADLDDDEPEPAATTPAAPTTRDDHSDEDTDDEIEKVLQQQKKRRIADTKTKQKHDDTPADTVAVNEGTRTAMKVEPSDDEEVTEAESDSEPVVAQFGGALPELFRGRTVAIGADCASAALMSRYVRAYGGLVLQMSAVEEGSEVDYVVRGRRSTTCGVPPAGVPPAGVPPAGVPPSGVPPTVVTPAWLRACFAAKKLLPPPAL